MFKNKITGIYALALASAVFYPLASSGETDTLESSRAHELYKSERDAKVDQAERGMLLRQEQMNGGLQESEVKQSAAGGVLRVEDNASNQALLNQAAYWESRGRSDLADKARSQLKPTESKHTPVFVRETSEPTRENIPVTRAPDEVKYRDRLAVFPRANSQAKPEAESLTTSKPTRQALDDRAQYWESRGRNDLAEQIRQKLQLSEAAPTTGAMHGMGRTTSQAAMFAAEPQRNHNQDAAQSALEDSLLRNPGSLTTRLNLAQIYTEIGELAKARIQVESVLVSNPDLPEALYVSAKLYAAQRLWWDTLRVLEKVSASSRTTEMAALQKKAWAHVQIDRADALVRQGRNEEAQILLRQVAVALEINFNQTQLAEPPPLWQSTAPKKSHRKRKR